MATRGFSPTSQEEALVTAVFATVDSNNTSILPGESAVQVLNGANLPPTTLGEIWSIADNENNGFLNRKSVAMAIRLIGYAQKGHAVREDLLKNRTSLVPRSSDASWFDFLHTAGPIAKIQGLPAQISSVSASPSPTSPPLASHDLPPLTTEDRAKFMRIFVGFGPEGGILNAEKAKNIFVKSKLPLEKLGQIWNLADTKSRGALDSTDFVLGMYFIQCCMTNSKFALPTSLPPGLYQQAAGTTYHDHSQQAFPTHHTGQSVQSSSTVSRMSIDVTGRPFPNASPGADWDITPQEKATADNFFNELDKQKVGYIEGDVAVPFMLKSQLPETALARIWDLSDLKADGKLTPDGFAVALHLINRKLAGKEVPSILPPSLVPPSHRPRGVAPPDEQSQDFFFLEDTPPLSTITLQPTSWNPFQGAPGMARPETGGDKATTSTLSMESLAASIEQMKGQQETILRQQDAMMQRLAATEQSVSVAKQDIASGQQAVVDIRNQLSSMRKTLADIPSAKTTATQATPADSRLPALEAATNKLSNSFDKTKEYLSGVQQFLHTTQSQLIDLDKRVPLVEAQTGQLALELSESTGRTQNAQDALGERLTDLDDRVAVVESRVKNFGSEPPSSPLDLKSPIIFPSRVPNTSHPPLIQPRPSGVGIPQLPLLDL